MLCEVSVFLLRQFVCLVKRRLQRLVPDASVCQVLVDHIPQSRLQRPLHRLRLRRKLPRQLLRRLLHLPHEDLPRGLRNRVQAQPLRLRRILRHRIPNIRIIPVERSNVVRCTLDLILAERNICVCTAPPASRVVRKDNSVIPRLFECIRQNFLCPHRKHVCLACPFFNDSVLRIEYTLKLRRSIKGAAAFSWMVFLPFR